MAVLPQIIVKRTSQNIQEGKFAAFELYLVLNTRFSIQLRFEYKETNPYPQKIARLR